MVSRQQNTPVPPLKRRPCRAPLCVSFAFWIDKLGVTWLGVLCSKLQCPHYLWKRWATPDKKKKKTCPEGKVGCKCHHVLGWWKKSSIDDIWHRVPTWQPLPLMLLTFQQNNRQGYLKIQHPLYQNWPPMRRVMIAPACSILSDWACLPAAFVTDTSALVPVQFDTCKRDMQKQVEPPRLRTVGTSFALSLQRYKRIGTTSHDTEVEVKMDKIWSSLCCGLPKKLLPQLPKRDRCEHQLIHYWLKGVLVLHTEDHVSSVALTIIFMNLALTKCELKQSSNYIIWQKKECFHPF